MATADYHSSADLKGVAFGGYINEDVMQQIIRVLDVNRPFSESIGSDSVSNSYTEWPKKKYNAPNLVNRVVDGQDATTYNVLTGERVGNHCQISRKVIAVTTRARNSDVIGVSDEYAEQLMVQTEQLMRDVEAISLSSQGSQADNGDAVPGIAGGFAAWVETAYNSLTDGVAGGFANGTVSAPTFGTTQAALTEESIRSTCQTIYEQGFDPSILMCRPTVQRRISEYMFTDAARIGIQQTDTKENNNVAVGAVKIFITDFDVDLVFTPNRLMPALDAPTTENADAVYIYDPQYWRHGYLHNYRTEPLAKIGLSDRAQVAVDWTLKCLAEESSGVIADIDDSLAMTAS